jgi:hypothetical protein
MFNSALQKGNVDRNQSAHSDNCKMLSTVLFLNEDYKILAKIVAIRFRPTLTHIMYPAQCTSTPGRTIPDAVATTREALAHAELTKGPWCKISLDLASPFDNISRGEPVHCPRPIGISKHGKQYEHTISKCSIRNADQRIPIISFPCTALSSPRLSLKQDLHFRNEYFSDDGRTKINRHNHTAAHDMRGNVRRWRLYVKRELRIYNESETGDTYLWRRDGGRNKFTWIKGTAGWIKGH